MSGANSVNASGSYGTLGTPAATNVPGGRYESVSWIDANGNLWLFGGSGFVSPGANGELNDVWEFDSNSKEWTWMSGSNTANAPPVWGTLGNGATNNTPGARSGAVSWTGSDGSLWLFGGDSFTDLWKFNPTAKTWTWVSGSNTSGTPNYGMEGVTASSNVPGSRGESIGWIDGSGHLWLFGGSGVDSSGTAGKPYLNDLWRYQP